MKGCREQECKQARFYVTRDERRWLMKNNPKVARIV